MLLYFTFIFVIILLISNNHKIFYVNESEVTKMRRRHGRLRRKELKKRRIFVIVSMFAVTFLFASGYAAFSTNLNLNAKGNLKMDADCALNKTWEYSFKNEAQNFKAPCTGNYKIELWGAGGNTTKSTNIINPGNGGYTSGNIDLKHHTKLYVYVGDSETVQVNTYYNGGGSGEAPGGGATDIRLVNDVWDNFVSLKSRIMVAAGGGGGFYKTNTSNHNPGHAGGLNGYDADAIYGSQSLLERGYSGHGATQIMGGIADLSKAPSSIYGTTPQITNGGFGYGGYGSGHSSGGGSGYFGGGHGIHPGSSWTGGGGGSSFISGHQGCIAITEDSTEDNIKQRTGLNNVSCIDNPTAERCSYHYSNYIFSETLMIDGAGCKWTSEKTNDCSGQPQPDGSTAIGHTGNGYAKITLISIG